MKYMTFKVFVFKIQENILGQNLGEATATLFYTRKTKTPWMPSMYCPNIYG